jgi:hypothetical protein
VVVKLGTATMEFAYDNYQDWNNPLNKIEVFYAGKMRECAWACGPPKWMKIGFNSSKLGQAEDGRGRRRSGLVEAVREFDPGRVF